MWGSKLLNFDKVLLEKEGGGGERLSRKYLKRLAIIIISIKWRRVEATFLCFFAPSPSYKMIRLNLHFTRFSHFFHYEPFLAKMTKVLCSN